MVKPLLLALGLLSGLRAEHRPVLLISIDGLRPDFVLEAGVRGFKIPNLRQLMSDGSYATGVHGVLPTVTYPSHTTMVTGVSPARHGICSNTTFDPENRNLGGWYWYASDIQVPTLWDQASKSGLVTASIHWPVTVGAKITFNIPQYWRTGTADDRKLLRELSTPGLLDSLERGSPPFADGMDESLAADQVRTQYAIRLMELKRPGFMTFYLASLDHVEHQYGPFSLEAAAALEQIDLLVGALRKAAGSEVVLCVVSDHGFVPVGKDVNLLAKFRETGLIALDDDGHVKSWRATGWASGATGAVMINPKTSSVSAQETESLLSRLSGDPNSGIDRVLDAGEIARLGGCAGETFLVALKAGFTFGPRTSGALVTDSNIRGMHGYLPNMREMNSTFLIAGPGIKRGMSLGEIDMRDVAPTLARILDVKLAAAEGHDVLAGARVGH